MIIYPPNNSETTQPQNEIGWESKDKTHSFILDTVHKWARIVRENKEFLTGVWGSFNNILLWDSIYPQSLLKNIFVLESQTAENTNMTDSLDLLEQFVQYTQDNLYAHSYLLLMCLCYITLLLALECTRAKCNPCSNVRGFSSYLLQILSSSVFILYFFFFF